MWFWVMLRKLICVSLECFKKRDVGVVEESWYMFARQKGFPCFFICEVGRFYGGDSMEFNRSCLASLILGIHFFACCVNLTAVARVFMSVD